MPSTQAFALTGRACRMAFPRAMPWAICSLPLPFVLRLSAFSLCPQDTSSPIKDASVAAYLSAGGLGWFALAMLSLDLCHTECKSIETKKTATTDGL